MKGTHPFSLLSRASHLWCEWLQRSLPHKKNWLSQFVEGREGRRSCLYSTCCYICKVNTHTVTLGAVCEQHGTGLSHPNAAPLNPMGISPRSSGCVEKRQKLHSRVNLRKAKFSPAGDASQSYDKYRGEKNKKKIYRNMSDGFLSML